MKLEGINHERKIFQIDKDIEPPIPTIPNIQRTNQTSPKTHNLLCAWAYIQPFFWAFLTVLREGIRTILIIGGKETYFIKGVSFSEPKSSIPLAAITGILIGILIGLIIHRASGKITTKYFFHSMAYILLLMDAGIFSRSVGKLEDPIATHHNPNDIDKTPIFDPRVNIWYLPCCHEMSSPGYGILFSLLGYRSIATIGTILSYISFWILIISIFILKKFLTNSIKTNHFVTKKIDEFQSANLLL